MSKTLLPEGEQPLVVHSEECWAPEEQLEENSIPFEVVPGEPTTSSSDIERYFRAITLTNFRRTDWYQRCGCDSPQGCDTNRRGKSKFRFQLVGPWPSAWQIFFDFHNFGVDDRWGRDGRALERIWAEPDLNAGRNCHGRAATQFSHVLRDDQRVHEGYISNQTRKVQNGYCTVDQFILTAAIRVSVYESFGPGQIRYTWILDPTFGTFGKNWNQCGYDWNLSFVRQP